MQAGEQRRHRGPFTARVCDKADKGLIVRDIGGELALYWQSVSNPAPRRMVEGRRSWEVLSLVLYGVTDTLRGNNPHC